MTRLTRASLFLSMAAATGGAALAQNDECATALAVNVGTHAFDTSAATLSAMPWPCAGGGGPDLWYTHVAGTTGTLTLSTCGSTYDTALEVFTGTCAALVPVACNDDACGLQSTIQLTTTPGTTYTFRIGGWNNSTGAGTLLVDDGQPRLNPVNGNYYQGVAAVGITWDQARLDAAAATHMGLAGRLVSLNDQQENDFVFGLGDVDNYWVGGFQNTQSPTYSEPAGGWEWITGEPFTYTNWLVGEPNNTGGFGAEDYLELLQGTGFGESWNDAAQMEHPRGYVIEFSSDTLGMNYCMAVPNSSGGPGTMSASGSTLISDNDVTLEATSLPTAAFGFFITSQTQGFVANPNGSFGNLCVGGAIGRYVGMGQIQNSGSAGEIQLAIDLTLIPTPTGLVSAIPGDTWNFTTWFRDLQGGMVGSNFTDGLAITFN